MSYSCYFNACNQSVCVLEFTPCRYVEIKAPSMLCSSLPSRSSYFAPFDRWRKYEHRAWECLSWTHFIVHNSYVCISLREIWSSVQVSHKMRLQILESTKYLATIPKRLCFPEIGFVKCCFTHGAGEPCCFLGTFCIDIILPWPRDQGFTLLQQDYTSFWMGVNGKQPSPWMESHLSWHIPRV